MCYEKSLIDECVKRLESRLDVLIVDDELSSQMVMKSLMGSPLYRSRQAGSLGEARGILAGHRNPWACWLVDMKLGDGDGLTLLREYPEFPFKIVISGLGSMEQASEAVLRGGAKVVFDKGSMDFIHRGGYAIDSIASLGYLLKGECKDHQETFFMIPRRQIRSVSQWAGESAKVRRRLEQICNTYLQKSPRQAIASFWGLAHVLGKTGIYEGRGQYPSKDMETFAVGCLEWCLDSDCF